MKREGTIQGMLNEFGVVAERFQHGNKCKKSLTISENRVRANRWRKMKQ